MKTIHPAIAEHVMEENERLRGLLREIAEGCTRRDMPSEQTVTKWADRIDAALSQQAEPAPAQGEREAFEAHLVAHHGHQPYTLRSLREGDSYPGVALPLAWSVWQARPAQTAPQPEQSGLVEAAGAVIRAADWWSANEDSPKSALAHFARATDALRAALSAKGESHEQGID